MKSRLYESIYNQMDKVFLLCILVTHLEKVKQIFDSEGHMCVIGGSMLIIQWDYESSILVIPLTPSQICPSSGQSCR